MPPKNAKASGSKLLLPTDKIPLPTFLKMLNDAGMPMANAMAVAGKVYKTHNTQEKLASLTADSLAKMGISDKEQRRQLMDAVREFKVAASQPGPSKGRTGRTSEEGQEGKDKETEQKRQENALDADARRRAALDTFQESLKKDKSSPNKKRKRTRDDDLALFDPDHPSNTAKKPDDDVRNLQFDEVLNEEELQGKTVVINRAPVMMAWSCVVAEALGFGREEALSIASVYTEMNATAKGASLGIYDKDKEKGMEPGRGTAQPHVELMGRRIALLKTENDQWRALLKGEPVSPLKAHYYIRRSLAQMSPYLMGALYLLARSFEDPQKLNHRGYSLYCDFRPGGGGWGAKGDVKLEHVLRLREGIRPAATDNKSTNDASDPVPKPQDQREPVTLEEFEANEEGDFSLWDLYDGED
ncbi:hypothetical protein M408DRAFT_17386 [Serendipita vermifera MAFF 305830]|uniref:SAM domain-containing protein n=1 Tax=Serendipita vermifera MAFF 305830 TaxID=933852 RepID=A0A0C3AZ50_SERVB|nr:hypothetical protein M408DRAFT_17386 [Serendipita vermifera MAFF 305830]